MAGLVTRFFISEFKSSPRSLVALPANPYCHGVMARLEQGDVDGPGEVVITWGTAFRKPQV